MKNYRYLSSTHSTNALLKEMLKADKLPPFFAVRTAFQSAGKGQAGNSWESERGKNLLFSMVLYPHHIAIDKQFVISQLVSVAIVNVLSKFIDNVSIKWPNDIYCGDKKLGGILIENNLRGTRIEHTIVGIGINVNQPVFRSNAPNPVSIYQLTQKKLAVKKLFVEIKGEICRIYSTNNYLCVADDYKNLLYRKQGIHLYRDKANQLFGAEIVAVEADGELVLKNENGENKGYYFKEIEFMIS